MKSYKDIIGKTNCTWQCLEYLGHGSVRVRCMECGKEKNVEVKTFKNEYIKECNCQRKFLPKTEKQRKTVDLYVKNGYSIKATQEILGVSATTVVQTLRRAEENSYREYLR